MSERGLDNASKLIGWFIVFQFSLEGIHSLIAQVRAVGFLLNNLTQVMCNY